MFCCSDNILKEFKIATFDSAFGQSLGFPTKYLNALLTSVIVVAVVIGSAYCWCSFNGFNA